MKKDPIPQFPPLTSITTKRKQDYKPYLYLRSSPGKKELFKLLILSFYNISGVNINIYNYIINRIKK